MPVAPRFSPLAHGGDFLPRTAQSYPTSGSLRNETIRGKDEFLRETVNMIREGDTIYTVYINPDLRNAILCSFLLNLFELGALCPLSRGYVYKTYIQDHDRIA